MWLNIFKISKKVNKLEKQLCSLEPLCQPGWVVGVQLKEVRGCRGALRESCQPFRDYYTESRKQQASHPNPWLDTRGTGLPAPI